MPENNIGERMASLRKGASESQEDLAKVLQCSRGTVANYEVGKRTPDVGTLIRIAQHYNTTVDYLVGNSDSVSKEAELKAVCDYLGVTDDVVIFLKGVVHSEHTYFKKIINGVFSKECRDCTIDLMNRTNYYLELYGIPNIPYEVAIPFFTAEKPELKAAIEICQKSGMEVIVPHERKLHAKMMMENSFMVLIHEMAEYVYGYDIEYTKKKYGDIIGAKRIMELEDIFSKLFPEMNIRSDSDSEEGNTENG